MAGCGRLIDRKLQHFVTLCFSLLHCGVVSLLGGACGTGLACMFGMMRTWLRDRLSEVIEWLRVVLARL